MAIIENQQLVKAFDAYKKAIELGALVFTDNYFKQALSLLEKAYEINQSDRGLLDTLIQLYSRFKMNDKLQEVQKRKAALK